jgi:hypothetical protein
MNLQSTLGSFSVIYIICVMYLLGIFVVSFLAPYLLYLLHLLHLPETLQFPFFLISGEIPHELMIYTDLCNTTSIVSIILRFLSGFGSVSRVTWFDRHCEP